MNCPYGSLIGGNLMHDKLVFELPLLTAVSYNCVYNACPAVCCVWTGLTDSDYCKTLWC